MRAAPRHSSFAGTPWPFWPGCSDCGIGFAATYETGAEIRSLWTGGNLSKNRSPLQKKLFALAEAHLDDADREVRNLATALFIHCERLFTFLEVEGVEPTNNT